MDLPILGGENTAIHLSKTSKGSGAFLFACSFFFLVNNSLKYWETNEIGNSIKGYRG